ncbi:hypothetical protein IX39_10790 [Chryseobacterium formosense]|uniref:Tissue inhibitor of metalloproteinase n=1 Tax=Chryseobacterium formosense TaxID=236814 RepID=A0A085Z9G3_9FLAO|nr:hypothetical protein [Chryseobacterium formosense]KFF01077.1 hypothetical protein IX39_10790 [Chryseobacterium formosense]SFT41787.1 hypothetical protein SAMN05421857_0852 [Chryseobacterium formosense]
MKTFLFYFLLLLSINIFGCKCAYEPDIESSFKSADIVFIGSVYDINTSYKTGYSNVENSLSKVKIEKIYKFLEDDFKSTEITFFGQQLNSCDFMFREKGKYLIFGYFDPDTTFFYTTHCSATQLINNLDQDDYLLLKKLSQENKSKQTKNTETISDIIELEDRYPHKDVTNLKLSNQKLSEEIEKQRVFFIVIISVLLVIILILIWMRRKKK